MSRRHDANVDEASNSWESPSGNEISRSTFEHRAALSVDSRMSQPMYARQKAALLLQLQRAYGNKYVQRLVSQISQKQQEAADRTDEADGPLTAIGKSSKPGENHQILQKMTSLRQAVQRTLSGGIVFRPTTDLEHPGLEAVNVTDVGPYRFVPMKGIFEYQVSDDPNQLTSDSTDSTNYQPESIATGKKWTAPNGKEIEIRPADKKERIKKAQEAVKARIGEVLDPRAKLHKELILFGDKPRPFKSVREEDVLGKHANAHTLSRHVIGFTEMPTTRDVAVRAAFGLVGGIMGQTAMFSPIASAFETESEANKEVANAINSELVPNWPKYRLQLLTRGGVELNVPGKGGKIKAYENLAGSKYPDSEKPAYLDSSFTGQRPLYLGDSDWTTWTTNNLPGNASLSTFKPLTEDISPTLKTIHVRILASDKPGSGGWFVHSAYPQK